MLPKNESIVKLSIIGDSTQKLYDGAFTIKCILNNYESVQVALRTDRYNEGSESVGTQTRLFNRAIAELELRIIDSPDWWKSSDSGRLLFDQNVVFELFTSSLEAQKEWKDGLNKAAEESESNVKNSKKNKSANVQAKV